MIASVVVHCEKENMFLTINWINKTKYDWQKKSLKVKNKHAKLYGVFKKPYTLYITYEIIHKIHPPYDYQINKGLNNIFPTTLPKIGYTCYVKMEALVWNR